MQYYALSLKGIRMNGGNLMFPESLIRSDSLVQLETVIKDIVSYPHTISNVTSVISILHVFHDITSLII